MNPLTYGLVTVMALGVIWTLIILLVLPVRVTASLAWIDTAAGWFAHVLLTEVTPVCPRCGRTARLLGVRGNERWFYCASSGCANAPAWSEPTSEPQSRSAVAS